MADLSISKEQGDTSVSPHHSTSIDHIETTRNEKGSGNDHDELVPDNFAVTASQLPKGYFYSSYFLGTWFATGMSIASAWAGFAYVLPILTQINEDIGPDANIVWVALVYTLGLSVGLVLVGRITDIFGRRWFFIAASGLGLLGSIICATAKNVPTLIGGEALIGLGGSAGLSYSLILGELVPMKYRFMISATIYIFAIPTNCLGAAIATAFVLYTKEGWRWSYYICIICNATAVISWVLFYHPPNFEMKWHATSKRSVIKSFDYVGSVLFTAGLVVFLIGLFWGGTVYPWNSAAVICSIILGFLCLVSFVFYEAYAPLKQPLVPIRLFKNTGYVASVLLLGLAASVYYAFSLLFPQMVYILYSTSDPMWAGWISCLVGAGISLGEIVGGTICEKIGNVRYQCIVAVTIGGIFLAGMFLTSTSNRIYWCFADSVLQLVRLVRSTHQRRRLRLCPFRLLRLATMKPLHSHCVQFALMINVT
jgi:MFS family permease